MVLVPNTKRITPGKTPNLTVKPVKRTFVRPRVQTPAVVQNVLEVK